MKPVRIRESALKDLRARVAQSPHQEVCGLLSGADGIITRTLAATNAAGDPKTSYEIAPQELFALMRRIRESGETLLAIYHSHPNGRPTPSERDLAEANYPDVAHIVAGVAPNGDVSLRAFYIREQSAAEVPIESIADVASHADGEAPSRPDPNTSR